MVHLRNHLVVTFVEVGQGRHCASVVFMCEDKDTVDEVAEDGEQLVVVPVLIVFPCEVVVFSLRGVCGEDVTKDVLFSWELLQIFVEPYRPVARC